MIYRNPIHALCLIRPYRLASILSKRTIAPAKLDEIKIKANVLKAFLAKKLGVDDGEQGAFGRATAEL